MSDNRLHQPSYGAVALSVTCFAVYLITSLITFVAGAQHRSPLALAGTLTLAFAVLAAIALGLVYELQRRRSATWINLGWSALSLIVSTTGVMVQASQQHVPRRALTAIIVGTACTSGLPFALYAFLYRSRFRSLPSHQVREISEADHSKRSAVLGAISLWLSPALLLYPILLFFLVRGDRLSKQSTAGLELLLFLIAPLSAVMLAFAFRLQGFERGRALAVSGLALLLNGLLLTLVSLSV